MMATGMQVVLPGIVEIQVYLDMCDGSVEEAISAWEEDCAWCVVFID